MKTVSEIRELTIDYCEGYGTMLGKMVHEGPSLISEWAIDFYCC